MVRNEKHAASVLNILEDGRLLRGFVGDIGLRDDKHIIACQVRILNRCSLAKFCDYVTIAGQGICVVGKPSINYPIGGTCRLSMGVIEQDALPVGVCRLNHRGGVCVRLGPGGHRYRLQYEDEDHHTA